jgi:phosphate transport system permease protein
MSMRVRHLTDKTMTVVCGLCVVLALIPLGSCLWLVVSRGLPALSWTFLTSLPKPVGESGGGVGNGLLGTAIMLGMASLIGLPIGVGAGLYLAANPTGRLAQATRFVAEILGGVPSVVVGLAVYALVVRPMHSFSALAGSVALAVLMIPTLARVTEEVVKLVPRTLFEASLALGVPEWRSSLKVVARTALGGIVTGICLALARATGETAPLLFTALGNQFWATRPDQPMASLPVQIFTYAVSPYPDWQQQAWGAALVLLLFVGLLNGIARALSGNTLLGV